MYTSNQISGAINNQMAQFSNMQSYSGNLSASIGMAMPPMTSLGFSYGGLQDPYGQQSAGQFGNTAVSGIGSALQTAPGMLGTIGTGAGLMSMFGLGGRAAAAASYMDPMTGVLSGASRGARMMSGTMGAGGFFSGAGAALRAGSFGRFLGGAALGAGAAALPYYAAAKGAQFLGGNMIAGAQQDYAVQQSLRANFDFYNPQSRSGRGFSTQQQDQISDMMRGMVEQDPFTSMGELSRVMTKAAKGNLFQGVTSAREFGKKFKQMTDTLKETAKIMGTSMEGALSFFDSSKRMGFYNKTDILRNAQNAQVMAGGGLSSRGIMQAQAQGAAMARSQGFTGAQGAILARKSVQGARDMLQSGLLSESDLGEMTGGLRGEQAFRSLGRQMQQASYSLARSGVGRAVYAALAERKDGKFTGRLDKNLLAQFKSGSLASSDIRRLAADKLQNAGTDTKLSFLNMEKDIAGSFAAGAGAQGWMGIIDMVRSQRGGNLSDEKVKLLLKNMTGMGRRQIEYIMKAYQKQDEINQRNAQRATDLLRKRAEQADIKMNHTFSGIMRQISHGVAQYTTMPLQRMGSRMGRRIRDFGQSIRDNLLGRRTTAGLGANVQNRIAGAALGSDDLDIGTDAQFAGNLDLRSGMLQRMIGIGRSQAMGRSMSGFLNLARGGQAGGSTVTMAGGTFDQKRLAGIAEVMKQARDQSDTFFDSQKGALSAVRSAMDGLTSQQLFKLKDMAGSSDATAHRNKMKALSEMLTNNDTAGHSFQSLTASTAKNLANRMGVNYDSLSASEKESYRQLAQETVIGHARRKGGSLDKILGQGGAGLVDGNMMMSGQRLAQMRTKAEAQFASDLGGSSAVATGIGATLGAGVGGVAGGLLGSFLGPIGTAVGATLGSAAGGFLGGLIGDSASSSLQSEVSRVMKDDGQRADLMKMLASDKGVTDVMGKYDDNSDMMKIARKISGMSAADKARLRKRGTMLQQIRNREGATVAVKQFRESGRGLLGLRDADLQEKLGDDIAGQVRSLQKSLTGADLNDFSGDVRGILDRRAQLAQSLGGLSGRRLSQARTVLGKTAEGRLALANRMLYTKKMTGELEKTLTADSPEKFLAQLKNLGVGTGAKGSEVQKALLQARESGDVTKLQKALMASKLTKKEDALSVLTTMKDGVDKMAKTSEKLLDVMLTVHADKKGVKDIKASVDRMRKVPKKLQK